MMPHPLITATEVWLVCLGNSGRTCDRAWVRESQTCAHSPCRKETSSGSVKTVWAPEAGKETNREQQREKKALDIHQPFYCSFSLGPLQSPPVRGLRQHVCGSHGQSELLDTGVSWTQEWLRVPAKDPGLPTSMSSGWHTSLHPCTAARRHGAPCSVQQTRTCLLWWVLVGTHRYTPAPLLGNMESPAQPSVRNVWLSD